LEWSEAVEGFEEEENRMELRKLGFSSGECNEGEGGVTNLPRFTRPKEAH